ELPRSPLPAPSRAQPPAPSKSPLLLAPRSLRPLFPALRLKESRELLHNLPRPAHAHAVRGVAPEPPPRRMCPSPGSSQRLGPTLAAPPRLRSPAKPVLDLDSDSVAGTSRSIRRE